jgi:hypothetical protein
MSTAAALATTTQARHRELMFLDIDALLAALPSDEQLPRGKTH